MLLKIHMLTLGIAETNCYVVGDMDTREAIVIDPSDSAPSILSVIQRENWTVKEILATHSHFDHVLAASDLKAATAAPFRLHRADLDQLHRLPETMQRLVGKTVPPAPEPDHFVEEGDVISVSAISLKVLFTPGHSAGHVSYILHNDNEKVAFSGDCLFYDSIGRTDLPGGDYDTLMTTIAEKLLRLGDDFTVAPGHMQITTIGRERLNNPFVLDWMVAHSS